MSTATQHAPPAAQQPAGSGEQPQTAGLLDKAVETTANRQTAIRRACGQFLGVPPERVCDMLRNVWKTSEGQPPLANHEMLMGMSMIARFGLDPIAREIYVTRDKKGRLMTIIGIDGWIKILDNTEHYDGFDWDLQFTGDGRDKDLESVTVTIHSKTRKHPTVYTGFAREYANLGGYMMSKIPWHMLRLFSLHHAARLFTPVGGSVVTEDEARWMDAYEATPSPEAAPGPAAESEVEYEEMAEPEGPEPEAVQADPADEAMLCEQYREMLDACATEQAVTKLALHAELNADLSVEKKEQIAKAVDRKRLTLRVKNPR